MTIRTQLWDWLSVAIVSAIPEITSGNKDERIVWAKQGNSVPAYPFCSLHIVQMENDNSGEVRETFDDDPETNPDELVVENIHYRGVGSVSIDVYGKDAIFLCGQIKSALREARTIDAMNVAKIGLKDVNNTLDLTAVLDNSWEGRASFIVRFHYSYVKQKAVESIGQVRVLGDITDNLQIEKIITEP